MMVNTHAKTWFSPAFGLLFLALLSACGSSDQNSGTVAVNLSLAFNSQQAYNLSAASRIMAYIQRWIPNPASAQAQSVTDIATIQVQISGPDIATPSTATVPVSNPTNGQEIAVSLQAPVGSNRTITVAALNAANQKIFGGTLPNVTLSPGAPVNLTITLVRIFTVTVSKDGTGSGTVTSSPPGINCGATCSSQFEQGASVSLNAAAAPGSAFAGWSGDCSGTGACTLTGNATVTARFNLANTRHLHVDKSGSGTVTSDPSGISCGTACDADFQGGSVVTLTATPAGGSTFTGWSGAGCSGTGSCIVVMNADQTVNASFATPNAFTLTVNKNGVGLGTVTSDPAGIDCGATCSFTFSSGTSVTLTATPAAGSTFGSWSGSGCSGTGTCVVVMSQNRSVTATFNAIPATLTVNKIGGGAGLGTVTSAPTGINCGNTCSAGFPTGSSVTLTATAASGSTFIGWSGACSGNGSCTITMSGDQTVFAQFELAFTLTVNKSGPGTGTVTSVPPGIACDPTCNFSFLSGTVVTLSAVADPGSLFLEWRGGTCDVFGNGPCVITMDDNRTANARFEFQ